MNTGSFEAIGRGLYNRWQREKDKDKRFALYHEEILPRVVSMLREQVTARQNEGKLDRYGSAVIILGHDANPALLMILALRPETVTILHTPDKEKLISKRLTPFLKKDYSREEIEFVQLDNMGHEDNLRVIRNTVREKKKKHGRVVCDITGGKKIMSVQLGIMANLIKADIAYIDAARYVEGSSIPYPGDEVLFVQRSGHEELTEIQAVPYDRLKIGYIDGDPRQVTFDLFFKRESFSFKQRLDSEHERKELADRLNEKCASINARIAACPDSTGRDFEGLANIIRGILFPLKLTKQLDDLRGKDLRLIMDEEVAPIPWELTLSMNFGVRMPIIRMPNKDEEFVSDFSRKGINREGILLIRGSGEGIPGFDESFNEILVSFSGQPSINSIKAESRAELKIKLAEIPGYRAIIYFGHARYDATGPDSGWVCCDGSVFGTDAIDVLDDKPPEIIISSACESARGSLFHKNSFAYAALRAGCDTYIGTNWLLEAGRSRTFLLEMITGMLEKGLSAEESYRAALKALEKEYGPGDVSLYNYVYYGR